MKDVKVVFMGTPDFSVPILEMLIEQMQVVLVVTQPDKMVGRKRIIQKTPVKVLAEKYNIKVFQPVKLRQDYEILKELKPDLIVTCAYGQILSQEILDIPRLGAINVHASILPKYRGSAPIQWALLNGDAKTGVTLIYMNAGMDTGDMIAKASIAIEESDNVGTLHDKLSELGKNLLKENLPAIISGEVKREKQNDEEAVLAPMIKREDEKIDFHQEGKKILNKIRAFNPWPLAYFVMDGQEIKVIKASFVSKKETKIGIVCEVTKKSLGIGVLDGIIYLQVIKPFGKKIMDITSFLNGVSKENLLGKEVE